MKWKNFILLTGISVLFVTCQKSARITPASNFQGFMTRAQRYFTDSVLALPAQPEGYRGSGSKKIKWDKATAATLQSGKGVWVPVEYTDPLFVRTSFSDNRNFSLNNLTWLLMYTDAGNHMHAELVTRFPDSMYLKNPTGPFSGYVFVEDWWGHYIARYLYSNHTVRRYVAPRVQSTGWVTYCTVIYGYNYSGSSANDGYSWVETTDCYTAYEPDNSDPGSGYGGSIGGGGSSSGFGLNIFIGHNIIADIHNYFQCFQNIAGASYQVKVCVDQPTAGSRNPWNLSLNSGSSSGSNPVNTGHAFLVFSEINGQNNITRNVGFYPSNNLNPFSSSHAQGALNNDESHSYNISASFQVNSTQFFSMLNFVSQGNTPGYNYDLNTNNCTTFAINSLATGHIYLPSTIGYWVGGLGNDPGDFGEDIRNSNAPGMMKSTIETPHANTGSCN